MNTPSTALRDAVEHIQGVLPTIEVFYGEDGHTAMMVYQDDDKVYFISVTENGLGDTRTSSLSVPTPNPDDGWQTGWEA